MIGCERSEKKEKPTPSGTTANAVSFDVCRVIGDRLSGQVKRPTPGGFPIFGPSEPLFGGYVSEVDGGAQPQSAF